MKGLAIWIKEWRLLWRDVVGLIFLFILPMCLVLFITLTSSADESKPRQFHLLLINQDSNGKISQELVKSLKKINSFVIDDTTYGTNRDAAQKAVANGKYQGLVIIPAQISQQLLDKIQNQIKTPPAPIEVFFDPALPENFQIQVKSSLQILLQAIELQLWQQIVHRSSGADTLTLHTSAIKDYRTAEGAQKPNDVQQNVPAWALFGMFFIITPLSGLIVKERRLGVSDRLRLAPVSLFTLMWGKIGAFVCVNLLQLALMLGVGVFVLPWFGLPTLNVTDQPAAIAAVGLAAALAATGFGMLIGSLVKTPEQANVIGPFLIVILAAIGGIFVPVYFLPEAFKKITVFSPMYWALESFINIFVRNANISEILPNLAKLLAFAFVTTSLASLVLSRYRR